VLSVPLYTGGRIGGEQVEAEGRLAEVRAQLEETRAQIETEVLTALAAEEAARAQVNVAARNVDLAREEVELSSSRFSSGVADNVEVVNAQDRLARAEENRLRAIHQWQVARAQWLRAAGGASPMAPSGKGGAKP
jgi:outer membrane protein TolC